MDLNKIYPRLENCEITEEKEPCFYIEEEDKNIWILENINSELINIDAQDEKMFMFILMRIINFGNLLLIVKIH